MHWSCKPVNSGQYRVGAPKYILAHYQNGIWTRLKSEGFWVRLPGGLLQLSQPESSIMAFEYSESDLKNVHPESVCQGQTCTIHNRSDHHMRHLDQHWRPDRGIMERICEHGIGHPDPDEVFLYESGEYQGVHGCDGCCQVPR